jgi:hypothetical protein
MWREWRLGIMSQAVVCVLAQAHKSKLPQILSVNISVPRQARTILIAFLKSYEIVGYGR